MQRLSLRILSLTCLAALSACTGAEQQTETHSPPLDTGVLDLPETPYNYADLGLPAHLDTPFARDAELHDCIYFLVRCQSVARNS